MSLVSKKAPDFTTEAVVGDGEFKKVSLSDYKGKYVVLFFYPADFTFICPTEIKSSRAVTRSSRRPTRSSWAARPTRSTRTRRGSRTGSASSSIRCSPTSTRRSRATTTPSWRAASRAARRSSSIPRASCSTRRTTPTCSAARSARRSVSCRPSRRASAAPSSGSRARRPSASRPELHTRPRTDYRSVRGRDDPRRQPRRRRRPGRAPPLGRGRHRRVAGIGGSRLPIGLSVFGCGAAPQKLLTVADLEALLATSDASTTVASGDGVLRWVATATDHRARCEPKADPRAAGHVHRRLSFGLSDHRDLDGLRRGLDPTDVRRRHGLRGRRDAPESRRRGPERAPPSSASATAAPSNSPYWQTIYFELPPGADVDSFRSVRDVVDRGINLNPAGGYLAVLAPASVGVPPQSATA